MAKFSRDYPPAQGRLAAYYGAVRRGLSPHDSHGSRPAGSVFSIAQDKTKFFSKPLNLPRWTLQPFTNPIFSLNLLIDSVLLSLIPFFFSLTGMLRTFSVRILICCNNSGCPHPSETSL